MFSSIWCGGRYWRCWSAPFLRFLIPFCVRSVWVRSSSSHVMVSSLAYWCGVLQSLWGRLQTVCMYWFCWGVVSLRMSAMKSSFWFRFVSGMRVL